MVTLIDVTAKVVYRLNKYLLFGDGINDLNADTNIEDEHFQMFDQWLEILPTDQIMPVEVAYDPRTGHQVPPASPDSQATEIETEAEGGVPNLAGVYPALTFNVGTAKVRTTSQTEFKDGDCSDIQNGTKLVAGRLSAGVIQATEVRVE